MNRALAIVVVITLAVIAFVVIRRPSQPEPSPATVSKSPALETDDEIVGWAQTQLISNAAPSAVKTCGIKLVGAEFEGEMVFKTMPGSVAVTSVKLEVRPGDAGVQADATQLECVRKLLAARTSPTGVSGMPKIPDGREYEVNFSLTLPPVRMGYEP